MRLALTFFLIALPAGAQWTTIAPGVSYRRFVTRTTDIHVARVDLTKADVISSRESDRNRAVSEFARRTSAIVAVNADFFTPERVPIGLAIGPCGRWDGSRDNRREAVLAFGGERVEIYRESELTEGEEWMDAAVGGFPVLISRCRVRKASELPGPRRFTHGPHPRTAVGFSGDEKTMFLVVADGRRKGVPGLTLPELARWMRSKLRVCAALNLDGGGSSAMWLRDGIVNQPSDGIERRVANHLAVVPEGATVECDHPSGPK